MKESTPVHKDKGFVTADTSSAHHLEFVGISSGLRADAPIFQTPQRFDNIKKNLDMSVVTPESHITG
jgi:hypothetical protein